MFLVSAWGFEPVALTAKFYSSSCAANAVDSF